MEEPTDEDPLRPTATSTGSWNDLFSDNSTEYRRYRFAYPGGFFKALAERSPATRCVWDCGAGSGQASVALTGVFDRVVASEASSEQLAQATHHDRVEYRAERVERTTLEDASVDAVLAAQAAHWFHLERFYRQVRRVARPGGLVVLSTYSSPRAEPRIEQVVHEFVESLGPWWSAEAAHPFQRYERLPFPFEPVEFPEFECRMRWSMEDLLRFMSTWSGVVRAVDDVGPQVLIDLKSRLSPLWGEGARDIAWPIWTRVGRI